MCTVYRDRPIRSNTLLHTTDKSDSGDNNAKSEEQLSSYACSAEHRTLRARRTRENTQRVNRTPRPATQRERKRETKTDQEMDTLPEGEQARERARERAGEWESPSYHPPRPGREVIAQLPPAPGVTLPFPCHSARRHVASAAPRSSSRTCG